MLNSRTHVRAILAATVLASGALVAGASVASAASGTTITLNPSDVAATSDPLTASGTCAAGSRTAVVTVSQNGAVLTQASTNVGAQGYSVALDISQGTLGPASVSVDCFKYTTAAPLGSVSTEVLLDDGSVSAALVPVTVSPSRVHIGGQLTITATCPAGTPSAEIMAGTGNHVQPFFDRTVTPAADGTVRVTTTVAAGPLVTVGPGGAAVMCGDPNNPAGIGFADLTVLAALPAPAAPPVHPAPAAAASAVPTLARTGSDALPTTALALGLLAAGGALIVARRRLTA